LPPFRQLQKGEPQKGSIPLQWWLQGGWAGRPTQLPGSPYSCAGTGGLTGLGWEAYEAGVGGGQHHPRPARPAPARGDSRRCRCSASCGPTGLDPWCCRARAGADRREGLHPQHRVDAHEANASWIVTAPGGSPTRPWSSVRPTSSRASRSSCPRAVSSGTRRPAARRTPVPVGIGFSPCRWARRAQEPTRGRRCRRG